MSYGNSPRSNPTRKRSRYKGAPTTNAVERNRSTATGDPVEIEVALRADAFFSLFERVNGSIARRDVPTRGGATRYGTGHTDGETITIDETALRSALKEAVKERNLGSSRVVKAITHIEGLNYHELSHVLFTPRHTHRPTKGVLASPHPWATFAYNVLEDTRIEGLFLARYSAATPYFRSLITNFILAAPGGFEPEPSNWLLLHGRRYMDAKIRNAARKVFEAEFAGVIESDFVANLIDEYRLLVFPKDADRALELVEDLANIIEVIRDHGNLPNEVDTHDHHRKGKADNDEAKEANKTVKAEAEEAEDAEGASAADESSDTEEGDESEGAGSEGDEKADSDGVSASDNPGEGAEGDEASDSDEAPGGAEDGAGGDAGNETNSDPVDGEPSLRELLEEAAEAVEEELAVKARETLKNANEEYVNNNSVELGDVSKEFNGRPLLDTDLSPGHKIAKADLVRVFEELRGSHEPHWVKRVDRGRLNLSAAMEARGLHTDVFDKWTDDGEDAASVEAVVLVDLSSSMSGMIHETTHGLWILTAAADELDIPLTVLGYNTEGHLLAKPGEGPFARHLRVSGGTNPTEALASAERIFLATDARHKLLFSLTDGDWWDSDHAHDIVDRINALPGARSVLIYLASWISAMGRKSVYANLKTGSNNHHHHRTFVGSPREAVTVIGEELTASVAEGVY